MLLMKQGEQAWLLTQEGTHEYARIYWIDKDGKGPRYHVRDGFARVGSQEMVGCDLDERGANITWSKGAKSWIPRDWYQYTWTV